MTNRGGRPRALTMEQVRQRQFLEAQNNEKGGNFVNKDTSRINNLTELRRLWKHRQVEAGLQSKKAGIVKRRQSLPRRRRIIDGFL